MSDPNTSDQGGFDGLQGTDGPIDAPLASPAAEPSVEAAPDAPPVEQATAAAPEPPSEPAAVPPPAEPVDDEAPLRSFLDTQPKDYTDLVTKYQAGGKSLRDAMAEANAQMSRRYWESTRAEAEKAKAAQEPTAPPAVAPEAPKPQITSPDVAALEAEVEILKAQFAPLYHEELELVPFKTKTEGECRSLVAQIERKQRAAFMTTDYDKQQELFAEVKALYESRDEKEALLQRVNFRLGQIVDQKDRLELRNAFLGDKKERALAAAAERSREAERQEQARRTAADEAAKAEATRREAFNSAFDSSFKVAQTAGDPLEPEEIAKFKNYAVTFYAHHPKGKAQNPAEVLDILKEAKAAYDGDIEFAHRKKSRLHALKKEQDVNVNAPSGAAAVAPAVKRGSPAYEADSFTGLSAS